MTEPEQSKVWVVETNVYADVPKVECYVLVERMKANVKVLVYGGWKIIRPAIGRKFLFDEWGVDGYVRNCLEHKLGIHERAVDRIQGALRNGVDVHLVPSEKPTHKEIKL